MGDPVKSKSKLTLNKSQMLRSSLGLVHSSSRVRMKRQSYGFSGVSGIRPIERTSQIAFEFKRPPQIYLNTYQIDPFIKFNNCFVRNIIDTHLDEHFNDHKYNVQETPAIALRLAGDIMKKLKHEFNRYRIISIVTMGQRRAQSYNNAISFLWDYERDSYVDVQRENNTVFAHVTCFGVYLD